MDLQDLSNFNPIDVIKVKKEVHDKDQKYMEEGLMLNPNDSEIDYIKEISTPAPSHDITDVKELSQFVGYHDYSEEEEHRLKCTLAINKDNKPIIIPFKDKNKYKYTSNMIYYCRIIDNKPFIKEYILKDFYQDYLTHLKQQDNMKKIKESEDKIMILNSYNNSNHIENNKTEAFNKYYKLLMDPHNKETLCRLYLVYSTDNKPILLKDGIIKNPYIAGPRAYMGIINKRTNEVLMLRPGYHEYADFNRSIDMLKYNADYKLENPFKQASDIRRRGDIRKFDYHLNYSNFVEPLHISLPIESTLEMPPYPKFFFNEIDFIKDGDIEPNLKDIISGLLNSDVATDIIDFLIQVILKSNPHKYHPFGEKYFGVKFKTDILDHTVYGITDQSDYNILRLVKFISPMTQIAMNYDVQSINNKNFKDWNQVIKTKSIESFLREVIFESDRPLNNVVDRVGQPTVYFEFNHKYYYNYSLYDTAIVSQLVKECNQCLHNFLLKTEGTTNGIKYDVNNFYPSSFIQNEYTNYHTTNNIYKFSVFGQRKK